MVTRSARVNSIVAIDGTCGPSCPVVTFQFPPRTLAAPHLVTLTLCEWQRVAQQITQAALALGGRRRSA
jgi:hypothetical protein